MNRKHNNRCSLTNVPEPVMPERQASAVLQHQFPASAPLKTQASTFVTHGSERFAGKIKLTSQGITTERKRIMRSKEGRIPILPIAQLRMTVADLFTALTYQ